MSVDSLIFFTLWHRVHDSYGQYVTRSTAQQANSDPGGTATAKNRARKTGAATATTKARTVTYRTSNIGSSETRAAIHAEVSYTYVNCVDGPPSRTDLPAVSYMLALKCSYSLCLGSITMRICYVNWPRYNVLSFFCSCESRADYELFSWLSLCSRSTIVHVWHATDYVVVIDKTSAVTINLLW